MVFLIRYSPQLARNPVKQPFDFFLEAWVLSISLRNWPNSSESTSKSGIESQRLRKCASQRQIAANTIIASTTISRRSSNSLRRSLITSDSPGRAIPII